MHKYSLFLAITLLASTTDAAERSQAAKNAYKAAHPCQANGQTRGPCPGYVIDHITPLACGGADAPHNMQWQTIAQGKAKDKWERKQCQRPSTTTGATKLKKGPRGGCYTITPSGQKSYVARDRCGG